MANKKDTNFYVLYDSADRVRAVGYKEEIMARMRWSNKRFSDEKWKFKAGLSNMWHFEIVPEGEEEA